MPKKLTTKEDLLRALTDKKIFPKYQLAFYYEFQKTVDLTLLDDFDVMNTIIEVIPHSYEYIKYTHLKDNRDLALLAIKIGGNSVLKYGSKIFRTDRELIEEIINHGEESDVTYFSEDFLNDIDFISKACSKRPSIYKYLPPQTKDNEEVINSFLKGASQCNSAWLYKDLPDRYLNNKEFLLNFITDRKTSSIYSVLSDDLKKDYDISYKVAMYTHHLFSIQNEEVKDNFDVIADCIKEYSNEYLYASERLKNDERIFDILLQTTIYDWSVYKALPDKFKQRKEIILRFDPEMIDFKDFQRDVSEPLQKDPDIVAHFGGGEVTGVSYFWYHGFYTKEEKQKIKDAINNHDYDAFMEMYSKNGRGLPQMGDGHNEKGTLILVDITKKENFMKITFEDSEAG